MSPRNLFASAILLLATLASAGTVTLNFEGASGADYYNVGPPPGQGGHNFGVLFSSNVYFFNTSFFNDPGNIQYIDPMDAHCTHSTGGVCDQSTPWPSNTVMAQFPTGGNIPVVMNVLGGFTNFLQFTSSAADIPTTVDIFSGLNGTGNLLAEFALNPLDPWSYDTEFDATHGGIFLVDFNGTAHSVLFNGGTIAGVVDFDDISFNAPGVPEPGTLALFASGMLGLAGIVRRKMIR